jgi:predicted TPR repeat methyltransferase
LRYHGRYSHSESYVRTALEGAAFNVQRCTQVNLRTEAGQPVGGFLVTVVKG